VGLEKLVQYLLDEGRVTPEQIAEARRTQGFFGGQIGSHILKLGFVDEASLGEALSRVTGVPYASGERLRVVSEDALASLDPHVAEKLKVCPVEREAAVLRIAMLNPRDAVAIAGVRSATGCEVEAWVTCEYRLYQALEQHYRVGAGRPRAITLAPPLPHERAEGRSAGRAAGSDAPRDDGDCHVGLDGRPLDAEVAFEEHYVAHQSSALEEVLDAIESVEPDRRDVTTPVDRLGALETELVTAGDRGRIADALLEFCAGHASRAALFAVAKGGLRGVAGRGRGLGTERLRSLELAVEPTTVFGAVLESREFYFGSVPPLPVNRELYEKLGGRIPVMAMVLPIPVKSRIAALLYLDDDEFPMRRPDIPLMRRVAVKTGLAFEILLLRGKLRKV
jgi:hypothetical protein